jgi:hypothetical protein
LVWQRYLFIHQNDTDGVGENTTYHAEVIDKPLKEEMFTTAVNIHSALSMYQELCYAFYISSYSGPTGNVGIFNLTNRKISKVCED